MSAPTKFNPVPPAFNEIKNTLKISTTVNKDSLIYKYELKASLLYDLINNTKTYQEELKNKPIIL